MRRNLFKNFPGVKNYFVISFLVLSLFGFTIVYFSYRNNPEVNLNNLPSVQGTVTPQAVTLTVNANNARGLFTNKMLGVAFVNWEHVPEWGRPFLGDLPQVITAYQQINPGVIRYAGGNWANWVGWDRVPQRTPIQSGSGFAAWYKDGRDYYFHYGTDEIDSLAYFADQVGAEVMIQVNVTDNNPAMWADMVRYANIDNDYRFKYWEIGNELDLDTGYSPEEYASRVVNYYNVMKAVDPSIKIIVGVPSTLMVANDSITTISEYILKSINALKQAGLNVDAVSYHWYQSCWANSIKDITRFDWSPEYFADTSWRLAYTRRWSHIGPNRLTTETLATNPLTETAITELNTDACDYDIETNYNHLGAVWLADVLGRMSYNGLDINTLYTGYGTQGYAAVRVVDGQPTLSSTYYTLLMYRKYFEDQIVESSSNNNNVSIWASRDSTNPNKLTLMISNINSTSETANITINNFNLNGATASYYTLTPQSPITALEQDVGSYLNGQTLNINNLENSINAISPVTQTLSGNTISRGLPAYSVTAVIIVQTGNPTYTPSSTPTRTPTPSRTPTPTRTPTPNPNQPTNTPPQPTSTSSQPTVTPTPDLPFRKSKCDINGDNNINISDLSLLASNWQKSNTSADINGDGIVNISDLSILASNWNKKAQ